MTTKGILLTGSKTFLVSILLSCLCICNGCITTTVHVYDGAPLPKEQISKVIMETRKQTFGQFLCSTYASAIFIERVDGKDPQKFGKGTVVPLEVFVLPGSHSFDIKFSGPRTTQAGGFANVIAQAAYDMKYSRFRTLLTFTTLANHEYIIRFLEHSEPWKDIDSVVYWVEDVKTGTVLTGIKPAGAIPLQPENKQKDKAK